MSTTARTAFVWLAVGALAGSALLVLVGQGEAFAPYVGPLHPVLATTLVLALGFAALGLLEARGWFVVRRARIDRGGVLLGAGMAAVLAVPVIVLDLLGGFPRDINVEPPASVVFYPVVAVVAEMAFHALPLALLLAALGGLAARWGRGRLVWGCIFATALIEPVLQVVWASPESPAWATGYVALHVLIVNVLGLALFRRHDFVTMYLFRVFYYLGWHVLWGALRLQLLFGG